LDPGRVFIRVRPISPETVEQSDDLFAEKAEAIDQCARGVVLGVFE